MGEGGHLLRDEPLFFAERMSFVGGWWQWHLESVSIDVITSGKGFNEQAGGACQTKLMARWHLRRAKRRMEERAWARENDG